MSTVCDETAQLTRGAHAAIAYLAAAQRPSGELPTFSARRADMADARAYPCSVYTTAFAVHGLRRFTDDPRALAVRAAAAAHLRAERNPDGSWSYEGRGTARVPPDLDDSACAAAALIDMGERPDFGFYRLLWENEAAPGGPYYTWVGVNGGTHLLARQLDALVNANLLLCAGLVGMELPGAAAYLCDVAARGAWEQASDYCLTPHLLLYCVARACADGPVPALAPAMPGLRSAALALPAQSEPFRLACLAAALLAAGDGEAAAPYLAALLEAQAADGSWPIAAAYSGYPPHFDGSPALTTAIALDAIGRALGG